MSRFFSISSILFISLATIIGCAKPYSEHDGHDHASENVAITNSDSCDLHAELHQSKQGRIVAEFPGHKYALEIIRDEKANAYRVQVFLTDAHFEPCAVDASEVRLNFLIAGVPKTFTLPRISNEDGKPITFANRDTMLEELIYKGWSGDVVAMIEIDGVPYQAKITPRIMHAAHSH